MAGPSPASGSYDLSRFFFLASVPGALGWAAWHPSMSIAVVSLCISHGEFPVHPPKREGHGSLRQLSTVLPVALNSGAVPYSRYLTKVAK